MPPPKDPKKLAEYREKMRRIALDKGYGKWMLGKKASPETRAKLRRINKANSNRPGEREARSQRAKENGTGKWMLGKKFSAESAAKRVAHLKGRTYGEIYGERAEQESEKRKKANRLRWEGVPRKPQREKHNGDYRYAEWRKAVFKRDNWTCRKCGYRGNQLQAHHMLWWSTHPHHRYTVANGRTLCRWCHKKYPRYPYR